MNPAITASAQWLERTLDDSANRRISIPEAFLAVDAILNLVINVISGCTVYPAIMERHLREELPFLATENILMRAVELGGDRQELHEVIREYSVDTARRMKETGCANDLEEKLLADGRFKLDRETLSEILDIRKFVGMAPEQARSFAAGLRELLAANAAELSAEGKGEVKC